MVRFKYQVDQDDIELQTSSWSGMERLLFNGKVISSRLNFNPFSNHDIALSNGHKCRFQLLVDPSSQQLICRIYKKEQLVASLKQSKKSYSKNLKYLQYGLLFICFATVLIVSI
ncbi:hypothetical protein D5R81_17705 [Parashewanella spongiae]|uniref:Uncharacterized protein n=1 Tax=Parashewanella spongiae TaxID=342950 RepID=A0A3A6TAP9_9GAMM|nr:hypothetical protein D5R81_17705 [Parashewanella spongiae]